MLVNCELTYVEKMNFVSKTFHGGTALDKSGPVQ